MFWFNENGQQLMDCCGYEGKGGEGCIRRAEGDGDQEGREGGMRADQRPPLI